MFVSQPFFVNVFIGCLWNPLILLVPSDKLLEGRLHEFNLPMLHASNATATGAAPTIAGIFSRMFVSCLL